MITTVNQWSLKLTKAGACTSCSIVLFPTPRSCSAVTDDGLAAVASGCKKMRMLNLCYCTQITDGGLKHVGGLEELTNLELRCLVRVTGVGITSIAVGCTSLVELDLKRCYSVDDAGLWALSRYSQNLRQVIKGADRQLA